MPTPRPDPKRAADPGVSAGDIKHPQAGAPPGTDNETMLNAEQTQAKGKPKPNPSKTR